MKKKETKKIILKTPGHFPVLPPQSLKVNPKRLGVVSSLVWVSVSTRREEKTIHGEL